MEQYRVYDRHTLEFVDGGIIKDYKIDTDYISNNASELTLTDATYAKKGDILVGRSGVSKTFMGAITAVDNTKKTISFKHMKELFTETVLNPFKFTGTIGFRFELLSTLELILSLAFVTDSDTLRRLPIIFETEGTVSGAVWTEDSDTLSVADFIGWAFDRYNVYLDFDLDFTRNKIVCRIIKNITGGLIIKDNIKLSTPAFDNNDMPAHNKAVVYDKESGQTLGTFYLLLNNTLTTDSKHENRILPVHTKYIAFEEEKGYTAEEAASSELLGNIYNHNIQYKLSKEQRLIDPFSLRFGDGVKIIYSGREYDSIFTGLKYTKDEPYITCLFGKTRIDFTDRLKQYIDKRYRKI